MTSTLGHRSPGKTRKGQSHLYVFMVYAKLSGICLETEWGKKPCVLPGAEVWPASYSPLPMALNFGRSQFTLTFPKTDGGRGREETGSKGGNICCAES